MNCLIVGHGTVGQSLDGFLKRRGHKTFPYDPPKNLIPLKSNIKSCAVAFISITTDTFEGNWGDYLARFIDVLYKLKTAGFKGEVFLRSSLLPSSCLRLRKEIDFNIHSMPEFLTERRAGADMENLPMVIGSDLPIDSFTKPLLAKHPLILLNSPTEAEFLKFAHNCFGAMKVSYFNMINEEMKKHNVAYENIREALTEVTGFINPEHMRIALDGKLGFGGRCFPVNMLDFNHYLFDSRSNLWAFIFNAIRKYNESIRERLN
jgi:UDPglucose 6-dehydrogenase